MAIAFVFPGQGSQYVGMGEDLWEKSAEVKDIFALASEICGKDMVKLCFEGPMEELTQTVNLQPALTAVDIAVFSRLREYKILPQVVAGHSLGEYPALYAAGVLSLEDTFKVVKKRAELMQAAAEKNPGGMMAIVKLDIEKVKEILADYKPGEAELANYNSPAQIVISGRPEVLKEIGQRAKESGGRGIPLKVSGAWHSSFIKEAQEEFREFLEEIEFRPPQLDMFFNVTAKPETDPKKIKELMWQQLCAPVLWCEEVKNMHVAGVNVFVETGPKQVLKGLIEKTLPANSCKLFAVERESEIKGLREM